MDTTRELAPSAIELAPGSRLINEPQATRVQEAGGEEVNFRLFRELADLPVVARLTVEGEPASKARPRFTKTGRAYTPEKSRDAEKRIEAQFRMAAPHHKLDANTAYGVMGVFFCGTRQRRDVDNMMKLVLDGLNGVAWPDDSQVTEISGRKVLVGRGEARSEIVVYSVAKIQGFFADCLRCGKPFTTFASWVNAKSPKKYCSRECAYRYRVEQNMITCPVCGKEFTQASRPKSKYCSKECSGLIHRVTVICDGCGKPFSKQKCYVRARNFCTAKCRDDARREQRAVNARGICETCGGATSKKSYRQCQACKLSGSPPSGKPWGRQ